MRATRAKDGQALLEAALAVPIVILLALGTVEFGRAFFLGNYIAHAARDGARMAAVLTSPGNRNSCQKITDFSPVRNQVTNELGAAGVTGMSVDYVQSCATGASAPQTCGQPSNCDPGAAPCSTLAANNIPYVTVCVSGTFSYLFGLPFVGRSFTVVRSATFRDEQR